VARLFVRLKLSLLRNGLRRGWQQVIATVFGALYALPIAVLAAVGFTALGRRDDLAELAPTVLLLALTVLTLGWLLVPLLAFKLDETLDPLRLRLLPLSRRQLVVGLAAASSVGIGPLATLLALTGVVVGFTPFGLGAAIVLAAVAAQFAVCIIGSRALATALSARLRSRRGRDVAAFSAAFLGIAVASLGQLPNLLFNVGDLDAEGGQLLRLAEQAAGVLRWLPSGWAASAIVEAAAGRLLPALLWLTGAVLLVGGLARWWLRALENTAVGSEAVGGGRLRDAPLFPRVVGFLPRNRTGAAAARELRYLWRIPQLRVQLLFVVLVAVGAAVAVAVGVGQRDPRLVLAAPLVTFFYGLGSLNSYGADRAAVWLLVVSGSGSQADLAGKNLAGVLVMVPIVTAMSVALAAATGGWSYVPVAMLAGLALLGISFGVGNLASVLAPMPMPESGTNLWATSGGAGCATLLVQLIAFTVQGLLLLPVVGGFAAALLLRPALLPLAALGVLVWGAGVWWVGLRAAASTGDARGPELVAALSRPTA